MKTLKHHRWLGRSFVAIAAAALIAATIPAAPAAAQVSGQTNISIDFPPLIILYYYGTMNITLTAADLEGVFSGGTNPVNRGIASSTNGLSPNLNIDASLASPGGTATATLDLVNSWAVRAIATSAQSIQVGITIDTATLTLSGSDQITMSNGQVCQNGGASCGATTSFAPTGLGNAEIGDIMLDLDFTNATHSGTYSGGQFTITAQAV